MVSVVSAARVFLFGLLVRLLGFLGKFWSLRRFVWRVSIQTGPKIGGWLRCACQDVLVEGFRLRLGLFHSSENVLEIASNIL